ncbi:hypothetical protein [Sulfuriflexus mobilis]|uniref:hypothetical protein n=1 Tax=Sulfuriflexus mobilis TaxID=1811807 RepID=UPI000F83F406|nr:hypothetical protein [Sulfuriflexus mobilis]
MPETATRLSTRRSFVVIALALSMLFAALLAMSWGGAELVVKQPRYLMQQWEQGKRDKTTEDWQAAVEAMRLALRLNPDNPDYNYELGRLYAWRALEKPLWTEHARKYRAQAIGYYRKAVRQRPVWSLAWIQLAMNKTLNQELDDEAKAALEHAITYGPWEYGVHRQIIWLGLASWDHLPASTQQKITAVIEQSLMTKRDIRYIHETAERFMWQEQLNAIVTGQKSDNQ